MSLTDKSLDHQLLSRLFPDICYCSEHNTLVHSHFLAGTVNEQSDPNQACSKCPLPAFSEIDIVDALSQTPQTVKQSREAWLSHTGHSTLVNTGRHKQKEVSFEEGDIGRRSMQERKLWINYLVAAYNEGLIRKATMNAYFAQAEEFATRSGKIWTEHKAISSYDDDLMHFFTHTQLRATHTASKREDICKQYCKEHDNLGDLVPYRPMHLYKKCMICEKPKTGRQPSVTAIKFEQQPLFNNIRTRD